MNEENKFPVTAPAFRQRRETYLGVQKATSEKDIYTFLLQKLDLTRRPAPSNILDVGCATGDLLAFLFARLPEATYAGLDLDSELLGVARERPDLSGCRLEAGDALTARLGQFDLLTCFGVLGVFDSFEPLLENLLANIAPGGRIFVQALLNPDDIDVRIAYRDYSNGLEWMRGFNIFSRSRIFNWGASNGVHLIFHDFRMTTELPKRPDFPHRAYTIDLANKERRTTNGLCLLLPETLLEIHAPL